MFDIMFMRQKQNETARLIWIAPKGPLIRSDQISKCCSSSSRADAFTRSREHLTALWDPVWNAWIQWWTNDSDLN